MYIGLNLSRIILWKRGDPPERSEGTGGEACVEC